MMRRMPWWGQVLVVFALSRVWSTALLGTMFALATANGWHLASVRENPSFFTFSGSWDASFYRTIATKGYPTDLPTDEMGNVRPNPWAFLPMFPWLARALMLTGLEFWVAGVLISVVAGAGAMLVLSRLVAGRVGERPALWAVAITSFGPVAFILQAAYAESLALLLIFGALLAFDRGRYEVALLLGALAAFTRPGALALALGFGLVVVWGVATRYSPRLAAWRGASAGDRDATASPVMDGSGTRQLSPTPWGTLVRMGIAALGIAVAGLAWPAIADAVTGHPHAYLETELSWWTGFVGRPEYVPLTPWFLMVSRYLGPIGVVAALAVFALAGWWVWRAWRRGLGDATIAFTGSYLLYLIAVFLPQQSTFRLLLPAAPMFGDPAITRRRLQWPLLVGGALLQPVGIVLLWFLGYP
ncbi:MAG TPA: hypothetical protein VFU07_00970 [Candidatus Lumbricidophila sp.]|nr:hypothetical protein [Candidatus Lumbricidophila sp.]